MKRKLFVFLSAFFLTVHLFAQDILINEIMASNVDAFIDPSYNYGSWIELYNAGTEDYSLEGLYVTDDSLNLRKFRLNEESWDMSVPSKGFKVIYFDHHDLYTPSQVNFKLNYSGGTIYLTDGENIIASQSYPQAIGRTSYARRTNGGVLWSTTYTPTPGDSNAGSKFATRQLPAPVFDVDSAFVSAGQKLNITSSTSGATIYYTTDGTTPTTENGRAYNGPLTIRNNMSVRARAYKSGYLPSEVATRTFITDGTQYPFPIIAVSTNMDHLNDYEIGIFTQGWNGRPGNGVQWNCNWNMDWDRPVNFEYILPTGEYALNQEVDMSMCGGWSRAWTPHSFKLKAAKYYMGQNSFEYDFYPESKPGLKQRVLQIRNGGNDTQCRIKDAALQEIVRRSGLYVDGQAWKPVHVFFNGSYYTVLNMREPNNKRFAQTHYDIDTDFMDQFEIGPDSGYTQMVGTEDKFLEWYDLSANAADSATYAQICEMVDIDEYINYMAVQFYLGNTDWPQNNVKGFRDTNDGKFHFVLFDLDFAFHYENTSPFTTFAGKETYRFNSLYGKRTYYYDEETGNWEERYITPWQDGDRITEQIKFVTIFQQMLQNEQFRRQFIDTYCIVNASVFTPDRVKEIVNEMATVMNSGMKLSGESCTQSANEIMSTMTSSRQTSMITHLKNYTLLDLKSARSSTLNLSSYVRTSDGKQVALPDARIFVNGLAVPTGKIKGKVFFPAHVRAVAPVGYKFEGWTDLLGRTIKFPDVEFDVPSNSTTLSLRATWVKMTDEEMRAAGLSTSPVVVNELSADNAIYVSDYFKKDDWIELYNTTDEDIDLAGYYLTDNVAKPQKYQIPVDDPLVNTVIPAHGYKQIWCDKRVNIGPAIHANFKLAKEGGTVMLSKYDESGNLLHMDSLHYVAHNSLQSFGRYPDAASDTYLMERPSYLLSNVHTRSSVLYKTTLPLRGDLNEDGKITIADITLLIANLRGTAAQPADSAACDINGDGIFTAADVAELIRIYQIVR